MRVLYKGYSNFCGRNTMSYVAESASDLFSETGFLSFGTFKNVFRAVKCK